MYVTCENSSLCLVKDCRHFIKHDKSKDCDLCCDYLGRKTECVCAKESSTISIEEL